MGLTVHLDHEIEQRLQEQARASGESPDAIINRALLVLLTPAKATSPAPRTPFVVKPIEGMTFPPEWTSGNVQELIEMLEGPFAR